MEAKPQNQPFISVVIPAYNEEKYLPRALKALAAQTYPKDRYEVIVSNNNSTDNTATIAKELGARVVLIATQGYTYAVSGGLAQAKGEILAVTDADSHVSKTWLEELAKLFQDSHIVAMTGRSHTDFKSAFTRVFADVAYDIFLHITFAFGVPNMSGFNMAFRKDAYRAVGGFDVNYKMSPDVELGKRLKKKGKVVYATSVVATTSARRWEDGFFKTLWEYSLSYVYTNLLRKAPPVKQTIIR